MITLIVIVIKNAKYTLILPTDIAGEFSVKKVIFLYIRSTNNHEPTSKVKKQIFSLGASYKQIEATNTFCKSNRIADWTTDELKSKRPDLSWYIGFGNGVCNIGNNGGVPACSKICQDIDGCQYFSVSTTVACFACFIYKSCDSPISTDHDYKIYKMQGGNIENQD